MNELRVGILALATIASVIFMSLKVTTNQSGFGDYITYRTIIRDASGIFPKTSLKVAGINAGRIKTIELVENAAYLTIEILSRVTVTKGSVLSIKSVGFLGDKYLEIIIGPGNERLEENGFIPAQEGGGVEDLMKDASQVLKDVRVIVSNIKETMAPEGREPPLRKILNDVKLMAANAREASDSLHKVIVGNEKRLEKMVKNFEEVSERLAYHVNNNNKESAMSDIKEILANAKEMTSDMKELMDHVKKGRGTVGKLIVEDEIADEVQHTLASVQKIVGKVDAIRTELGLFTGANTVYGAETNLGLRIFPSPERFYEVGITTSEFGPEKEKHTTTTINGVSNTEVRTVKDKNSFNFNVQLGRKIQNWVFRGGLIESSGGLGFDYERSDWGSKFSLDVYDYRDDIGINLRFGTEVQLWNVFYGKVAVEDMIEDSRSATISAGLKFSDEDLKGLLGFFL